MCVPFKFLIYCSEVSVTVTVVAKYDLFTTKSIGLVCLISFTTLPSNANKDFRTILVSIVMNLQGLQDCYAYTVAI